MHISDIVLLMWVRSDVVGGDRRIAKSSTRKGFKLTLANARAATIIDIARALPLGARLSPKISVIRTRRTRTFSNASRALP